jgi:hypothetical protein
MSSLSQLLQPEQPWLRQLLVEVLAQIDGPAATAALARRAVFDLSPEARTEAVAALRVRPSGDALPELLAAYRHPWSPAADHATEALVALDTKLALPALAELLDAPDPCAPATAADGKPMVRELVRINHLRNCLLCHAPNAASVSRTSAEVPGLVPSPDEPIDRFSLVYYSRGMGDFVRADVTYLKQDFSVMLPVANPGKWPAEQRYDFVVRERPATADELRTARPADYPQRKAMLLALQALSGKDLGNDSSAWRAMYANRSD